MGNLYAVALAGLETIKNPDGSFNKFSSTFMNNIRTWKVDHPKDTVEIVDARVFHSEPLPMSAVWAHLRGISSKRPIDILLYSGHSGSTQLYFFSKVRKELAEEERYFCMTDNWEGVHFSPKAEIRLWGCQTGGERGVKFDTCIAQSIANKTKVPTWGFVSKCSQQFRNKGFYQIPDIGGAVKFIPKEG
jgi:hypothetical protein